MTTNRSRIPLDTFRLPSAALPGKRPLVTTGDSSKGLVFGIDCFPDSLCTSENQGWIQVPLTLMLALQCAQDPRLEETWTSLTLADHFEMHSELRVDWQRFQDFTEYTNEDGLFEFEFWGTHVLYLRRVTKRLLARHNPPRVILPEYGPERFSDCTSDEERLRWLTAQIVRTETEGVPRQFFDCSHLEEIAPHRRLRRALHAVRRLIAQARQQRALGLTRRRIGKGHSRRRLKRKPTVFVLAQPTKATEILRSSQGRKSLCFIPYHHLETLYPSTSLDFLHVSVLGPQSYEEQLWAWLARRLSAKHACLNLEQDILANSPDALITDARHDIKVRALVRACASRGIPVAIIPEGAAVGVHEHADFWESLRLIVPGVTYFSLNGEEAKLFVRLGASASSTYVTGYLGDTFRPSRRRRLEGTWTDWRARRLVRRSRREGSPVVGVTLDLVASARLMSLPGQTPALQSLLDYQRLLTHLSQAGFSVLVTARDPLVASLFRKHLPRANVEFLSATPWQWTARQSHVMISWLSSVAWETAALGVPVVVPRFGDVPSIAEVTLRGSHSDRVTVTCDMRHLLDEVDRVTRRRGATVGPEGAEEMCRRDIVSAWIDSTTASRSSLD